MLLEIRDISASYGAVHAVQDVSLALEAGEAVTVVGANGAGKSTTLKAISGLVKLGGGAIRFEGQDLVGRPAYRVAELGIAHVPEGRRVFPDLSVRENLNLGAYLARAKRERAESLERVFALFPILGERVHQQGVAVLLVEQNLQLALSFADRGYVLESGRVVLEGPARELLENPRIKA